MKITSEMNLTNFEFWSGAKQHSFTDGELQLLEILLEDLYPEGTTDTQINDLFWFEEDFLCELIGIEVEEYLER